MSCPTSLSSFLGESREGDCYLSLSLNSLSLGALLDTCKVNLANPPTFSSSFTLFLYPLLFHVSVLLSIVGLMPQIGQINTCSFSHHVSSPLSLKCATCPSNPSTTRSFIQCFSFFFFFSNLLLLLSPLTCSFYSYIRAHPICRD